MDDENGDLRFGERLRPTDGIEGVLLRFECFFGPPQRTQRASDAPTGNPNRRFRQYWKFRERIIRMDKRKSIEIAIAQDFAVYWRDIAKAKDE